MKKFPKINTIWKRDENNKFNIIEGDFSKEEFDNIKRWHITEKIDGTNIRITYNAEEGELIFGGRTAKAQIPTFLFEHLQKTFTIDKISKIFQDVKQVVLFGEGYGNRIQSCGKKYREDVSLILFDVWIDGWWLEQENVEDVAKKLGIDSVPFIGFMSIEEAIKYLKSNPRSKISKEELTIEGIVARSHPLMLFRDGKPIVWKLKVKDYTKLKK